ncbi:hypothetical protein LTS18_013661 [Coniosporium uncinatum]|uniref:Uncharacterized protein n=1 Tax=Coniosporium uncinatum TaxID=93489 RepID=A0ACC3DBZ5_9PEZI|nr:hypothetical protein LTS18_013661 [Coniosporium uncinatum]
MHLTALLTLTLTLTGLALATPVSDSLTHSTSSKRQLSTVKAAVYSVNTALNTAVTGIAPGDDTTSQTAAVTTASESLQKALTDGATSVKSATPLNLADALGLVGPTQQLASTANTTITNLIGKKGIIDGTGQTATEVIERGITASGGTVPAVVEAL